MQFFCFQDVSRFHKHPHPRAENVFGPHFPLWKTDFFFWAMDCYWKSPIFGHQSINQSKAYIWGFCILHFPDLDQQLLIRNLYTRNITPIQDHFNPKKLQFKTLTFKILFQKIKNWNLYVLHYNYILIRFEMQVLLTKRFVSFGESLRRTVQMTSESIYTCPRWAENISKFWGNESTAITWWGIDRKFKG